MFIEHEQHGKTFDEQKAFRCFNDAMVWRKQNNIYGKKILMFIRTNLKNSCFRRFS